jgi:hypothetical protein
VNCSALFVSSRPEAGAKTRPQSVHYVASLWTRTLDSHGSVLFSTVAEGTYADRLECELCDGNVTKRCAPFVEAESQGIEWRKRADFNLALV